jgi:uncharacterized membrane protein YkoI
VFKKSGAILALVFVSALLGMTPAEAGKFRLGWGYQQPEVIQYVQQGEAYGTADYAISPSQAAYLAKETWPGAKVLRVQLLPSGVYAVTLKQRGEVSRVLVDATSGSVE